MRSLLGRKGGRGSSHRSLPIARVIKIAEAIDTFDRAPKGCCLPPRRSKHCSVPCGASHHHREKESAARLRVGKGAEVSSKIEWRLRFWTPGFSRLARSTVHGATTLAFSWHSRLQAAENVFEHIPAVYTPRPAPHFFYPRDSQGALFCTSTPLTVASYHSLEIRTKGEATLAGENKLNKSRRGRHASLTPGTTAGQARTHRRQTHSLYHPPRLSNTQHTTA